MRRKPKIAPAPARVGRPNAGSGRRLTGGRRAPAPAVAPHVLGAIAAARNLLVARGEAATPEAITEYFGDIYSLAQVKTAVAQVEAAFAPPET